MSVFLKVFFSVFVCDFMVLGNNPIHVYLGISPTEFNGIYFFVTMYMTALLIRHYCAPKN